MKRILITGANSYIGTSFEQWVKRHPDKYMVDTVDMTDISWKEEDFSSYDVVFHVAGIAHVSSKHRLKDLYYKVNRDLAIETAKKAKAEGVKQFIFMSSIIVYGDGSKTKKVITKETVPAPNNFYGDSKLQAEIELKKIEDKTFKLVILRPPMVYGKGCKGNYNKLSKAAKILPFFPDIDNERSMIHIDNLCEFIRLSIENEEKGLFFPQDEEYVKTSEMVKLIAEINGHKIKLTKALNPIINKMYRFSIVNKVFGSLVYDKSISEYHKGCYRVRDLWDSIVYSEKGD